MQIRLLDVEQAAPAGLGAQAADLVRRCEHVPLDARVTSLGYRFYPMPGSELPSFFAKRFTAGDRGGAITLLAGIDPRTGAGVLEDCESSAEATQRISRGESGLWLVRLSYGARSISFTELLQSFSTVRPHAFSAFAAELYALAPLERAACPLCTPAPPN